MNPDLITSGTGQRYPSQHVDTSGAAMLLLGRIEGKLDIALQRQEKMEEDHSTLRGRVETLENDKASRRGTIVGVGLASGAGSGTLIATLTRYLGL